MEEVKKYEDAFFESLLEGNRAGCKKVVEDFRNLKTFYTFKI